MVRMTQYGSAQLGEETVDRKKQGCCRVVDYSEPVIWIATVFGVISLVYAILSAPTYWLVASVVLLVLGCLSTWRIRKLGVAFALMESVDDLRVENTRLAGEVDSLEEVGVQLEEGNRVLTENNDRLAEDLGKFEGMVGLLGEGVGDIEAAKKGLVLLYDNYKKENARYQANNTLSLFTIVDGDRSGDLSEEEVKRMQGYIRAAYGFELDLKDHDTNHDCAISLEEFVKIFEEQSKQRETKQ